MNEVQEQWVAAHRDMDMIVAKDLMWTIGHAIGLSGKLPTDVTWGWDLHSMRDQIRRSIDLATALRDAPSDSQETR